MQILNIKNMVIEKTAKELLIRVPILSDTMYIQDVIDYLRYKELTSGYKTEQSEVDALAKEINSNWWNKNKN